MSADKASGTPSNRPGRKNSMLTAISRGAWHTLTQNRRLLRAQQQGLLACHPSPRRVLEVGSGQRSRSNYFQSAVGLARPGTEFVMTDVDPALGHRVLDIRTPDAGLGTFDLVLCCNVLEHIADLASAIDGLAAVCAKDGLVFASTPFVYPYHDEPRDYWRPTLHGLTYLFSRRFADVSLSWTGLRRFPFQIFVHAGRPKP